MGRVITGPGGRQLHIGGRARPKVAHALKIHSGRYGLNLRHWPAVPAQTSYGSLPAAQPVLADVLGNDQLGDCTEANSYHLQALRQAVAGRPVFHPTLEQVTATYSRDGGYVPGDPSTDQGCDETVVLTNHCKLGITNGGGVDKAVGYLAIDATNRDLVRQCVTQFVGAPICMELPDAWINPFPSSPGWTWDVPAGGFTPDPSNGHCYTLADQSDASLQCWSWGMPFTLTYDALALGAVAATGGMIYILSDHEMLSALSTIAPDGLDWAQLREDFDTLVAAAA